MTQALLSVIAQATIHEPLLHFHVLASWIAVPAVAGDPPFAVTVAPPTNDVRQVVRSAAAHITPPAAAPPGLIAMLASAGVGAGVLVAGLLWRLLCRMVRARGRAGVTRRILSGAMGPAVAVLSIAVTGAHLDEGTAVSAPVAAHSQALMSSVDIAHRAATALGSGLTGVSTAPVPAPSTSSTDGPPGWHQLLALEVAIERASQGSSAPAGVDTGSGMLAPQSALAAEEALYAAAVDNQPTADALSAAAARTGSAEAMTAVGTDLAMMRNKQTRTAAAANAQSVLATLDSSPTGACGPSGAPSPLRSPMSAAVSQPFGLSALGIEPSRVVDGVWYAHFHTGLDLTAPAGTPVTAAAGGLVVTAEQSLDAAGRMVGYGIHVVIEHRDGCATLYGHLQDLTVHAGDMVRQGQVIGHEGSTGNSTGPHLHFEVRVNGEPVDPARYIG